MSRPIPEEEYNRKTLTKVIQWAKGEKDPAISYGILDIVIASLFFNYFNDRLVLISD